MVMMQQFAAAAICRMIARARAIARNLDKCVMMSADAGSIFKSDRGRVHADNQGPNEQQKLDQPNSHPSRLAAARDTGKPPTAPPVVTPGKLAPC